MRQFATAFLAHDTDKQSDIMKRFFSAIWAGWKTFAHKLGVFNTYVILTIFYFVILAIVSILVRIFKPDLLDKKWDVDGPLWKPRPPSNPSLEEARRQF